jgi:hypothetical protein
MATFIFFILGFYRMRALLPSREINNQHQLQLPAKHPLTLDIIVSWYRENISETATRLADIRSLSILQNYSKITTFVYSKNEDAQLSDLCNAFNTSNVFQIDNRGREGGTYLTHILRNYDNLATHNLFMQALMHNPEQATNRLIDYLRPNTGVLGLAFYEICRCTDCKDPWDHERTYPRLQELYSLAKRQICPPRIALSYLGQIVASRKRIRSQPLEVYQHIKDVLESNLTHYIHADPRQEIFEDSLSNPYFGLTVERSYMVLWDCDDPAIVESCGSGFEALAERRGAADLDSKCQCLDT